MNPIVEAWQLTLAAEQQAVFGYGLAGPHLIGPDRELAEACAAAHESLRDSAADAVASWGATPVAPLADYPSLYPVTDSGAARRLALRLEEDCARGWRFVYGNNVAHVQLREDAQANLTATAIRATRWRRLITPQHPTTPFPGL